MLEEQYGNEYSKYVAECYAKNEKTYHRFEFENGYIVTVVSLKRNIFNVLIFSPNRELADVKTICTMLAIKKLLNGIKSS